MGDISWSDYVKDHLLPRIYGFELLAAPYAIAHLKLSLFLQETGYKFDSGRRLEVILANTLDTPERKSEVLLGEYISEESDRAVAIKRDQPVMLVIGNPPYSYESENTGEWISSMVRDYYQIDGKPLGERNPKGLQDDYVKFIRFAQWKIQKTGQGILAFITNHGFLDNPTFRGLRYQLIKNFDALYFYDLHGNSKKKEKQPNGLPDVNVFDIQQGVSITFGIKGVSQSIMHCDLYGNRELKYQKFTNSDIKYTQWKTLYPQAPFYLLMPDNTDLLAEYERGWKIIDVFPVNSLGIATARDEFTIHWSKEEVWKTVTDFVKLPPEQARSKYSLGKDTRDWKVQFAQRDLKNHPYLGTKKAGPFKELLVPVLYPTFSRLFRIKNNIGDKKN